MTKKKDVHLHTNLNLQRTVGPKPVGLTGSSQTHAKTLGVMMYCKRPKICPETNCWRMNFMINECVYVHIRCLG